jgi:hypothetical protein
MDTLYSAAQGLSPAFQLNDASHCSLDCTMDNLPEDGLDHAFNHALAREFAFERAAADLQDVIHVIAERYLLRGVPLTWRLLHAIEAEALADLGLASRHDPMLLGLFVHPSASGYLCSDDLIGVMADCTVPLLTWFVLDVYGIPAITTPKRATHGVKASTLAYAHYVHTRHARVRHE